MVVVVVVVVVVAAVVAAVSAAVVVVAAAGAGAGVGSGAAVVTVVVVVVAAVVVVVRYWHSCMHFLGATSNFECGRLQRGPRISSSRSANVRGFTPGRAGASSAWMHWNLPALLPRRGMSSALLVVSPAVEGSSCGEFNHESWIRF